MNVCRVLFFAVVLLAVAGCKKKEEIVARVDGVGLTRTEMESRAMGYLKHMRDVENIAWATNMQAEAEMLCRKKAINTFVYKRLMLDEAARLDITISEQEIAQALARMGPNADKFFNNGPQPPEVMRRDFEDSLLINKVLNKVAQQNKKVMDVDVEAMAKEIEEANLVKRITLEAVRKQILDGEPFEEIARLKSEDPSTKSRGGDLGELARGRINDPAFENAVFSLPVGQVSEVVDTQYGYHLFKVSARNPAQPEKDGAAAIPETVRASHILVKRLSTERRQIADVLYKRQFLANCKNLYEELKAKAAIECTLYPDMEYTPVQ